LKIEFDPARPIYLQIIDEVKRQIAAGILKPGDKMPSQRDLAVQLQVNANTVQRAYREMELLGLVETLRGQGTFIRQDESIVEGTRVEMVSQLLEDFISAMHSLGYGEEAIVELVQAYLSGRLANRGETHDR